MGCYTNSAGTICNETTENAPCSPCDTECKDIISSNCIIYKGAPLSNIDIITGDELNEVLKALNTAVDPCTFTLTPGNYITINGGSIPVLVECGDTITFDAIQPTADNGLTVPTNTNIQLGGTALGTAPLLHNTFITGSTYTLDLRGTAATYVYKVINSSAGGSAIYAQGVNNGTGILAQTDTGQAVYGIANSGTAGEFSSTSGNAVSASTSATSGIYCGSFLSYVASNTIRDVLDVIVQHTGTPGIGIGTGINFSTETLGGGESSGRIAFKVNDVTAAAAYSTFEVYCRNGSVSRTRKFAVNGTGLVTFDDYASSGHAYADDAAAGVGGLATGQIYQTTGAGAAPLNVAGILMVKQ